jgi:Protein of unknown function (DUF3800)
MASGGGRNECSSGEEASRTVSNGRPFSFSDYIVYVDETGDHGLTSIDPQFPMFGLVFCLVRKDDYANQLVPAMQKLKFDTWGHDQIVLHERDIRKQEPPFGFLRTDANQREAFLGAINTLVADAPVELCVAMIDKLKLKAKYAYPYNPYEIALKFCMEWLASQLAWYGQAETHITVVIEARGKREDAELKAEFDKICQNQARWGWKAIDFKAMSFDLQCVDKRSNSTGLQIADLAARPIALSVLRPEQPNRAAEIALTKVRKMKVFP